MQTQIDVPSIPTGANDQECPKCGHAPDLSAPARDTLLRGLIGRNPRPAHCVAYSGDTSGMAGGFDCNCKDPFHAR